MFNKFVWGVLFTGLIVFPMWTVAPIIEGRFFPVTGRMVIEQVQPEGEYRTRIWGEIEKRRDCSFERIEFHLGTPGHSSIVDLDFEEASRVRSAGLFGFGPWLLHLSREQLYSRAFAYVYHRCHPLWLTRTTLYP